MSKNVRLFLLNCEQDQLISRTDNATSNAKSSQFANIVECLVQDESYLFDKGLLLMPFCVLFWWLDMCLYRLGDYLANTGTGIYSAYSHPTK